MGKRGYGRLWLRVKTKLPGRGYREAENKHLNIGMKKLGNTNIEKKP
jgi:hypothetical protein